MKEGREGEKKIGRKEGKKEGSKEGSKEGRKEVRQGHQAKLNNDHIGLCICAIINNLKCNITANV